MGATVPHCNKDGECEFKSGGGYCPEWKSDCKHFTTAMEH